MPSFKVPCASCEYQVLIKDPKLVGTKVECPKCKYRFKVEEPAGGIPSDGKADAKADKAKKSGGEGEDANKKKKKSKKLVAIVVGVLAVGVLAAVGFAVMGGDKKKTPPPPSKNPVTTTGPGTTPGSGNPAPNTEKDPKEDPEKKDITPKYVPKNTLLLSDRETTNLLPGQTVSFLRFDVERLRQSPVMPPFFDSLMLGMFKDSFGFNVEEISVYLHAFVGEARDPFAVMKIREPSAEKEILSKMALEGPEKVKGRALYAFK